MTNLEAPAAARPTSRRRRGIGGVVFAFISSPRVALALLVAVLACCIIGVTVFSYEEAWNAIFTTLWFNGLLVALALSSGITFLARTWGRKLTLVSVGMIVFHVSFMTMLGGVVFNSLFHFKGLLRLTEGETLPNGDLHSYDTIEPGRFFDFARLRGETTLVRMHRDYKVDGQDKRAAYEITVGEGDSKKTDTIFITRNLDHDGVRYLCSKEGYSVLVVMSDKAGNELYGAHVPLQSLRLPSGNYTYATGSADKALSFPFPPPPDEPRFELLVSLRPNTVEDRKGDVTLQAVALGSNGPADKERVGKVQVGESFAVGDFVLSPREIRYWVGMTVRYDPGLPVILGSLWAGLAGMTLTFIGRIRQDSKRTRRAATANTPAAMPSEGTT